MRGIEALVQPLSTNSAGRSTRASQFFSQANFEQKQYLKTISIVRRLMLHRSKSSQCYKRSYIALDKDSSFTYQFASLPSCS